MLTICKENVQSQLALSAAKKAQFEALCTKVAYASPSVRQTASDEICLGLIGMTSAATKKDRETALADCRKH